MLTEKEKLASGEFADVSDPEINASYRAALKKVLELNKYTIHMDGYRQALRKLIPDVPDSVIVSTPFQCDYGFNIRFGKNVFVNAGCCFLDGGIIEIGDYTQIGPSVQIYTPDHPMDYIERRKPVERSLPVRIGADCWIGGGVVICPGVTIGDRCIIGAGSVVVKDIPDDSLAVGNPARVVRKLNEGA